MRGDQQSFTSNFLSANFNSRPCVRGDTDSETSDCGTAYFNSRPCVRGDALKWQQLKLKPYFNSRPCVRGDCCFFFRCPCRLLFQFTPLREGRQQNSTKLHLTIYAVCRKSNIIFPYRNLFRLLKKLLWVYAKFAAYQLVCREWLPVPVCKEGSRPLPTNNRKVRYNWEKRRFSAGL